MDCYFPMSEKLCPRAGQGAASNFNISRGRGRVRNDCEEFLTTNNASVATLRAASTEFLFSSVSHLIQREAQRQLQVVFGSHGHVPKNLITVHIRWGDKDDEMSLVPVSRYVDAVKEIQSKRAAQYAMSCNIFLATEDPRAVYEFASAIPRHCRLFVDAYFQELGLNRLDDSSYNAAPRLARSLKGKPGTLALASLLVAMEASDFVLTTASNWSRLLNELRLNVVDPRCKKCTQMIDLMPGQW